MPSVQAATGTLLPVTSFTPSALHISSQLELEATMANSPPLPGPSSSFFDRNGTQKFENPDNGGRKYLAQINEWSIGTITWVCERAGGFDHLPQWDAYPVCAYGSRQRPMLSFKYASTILIFNIGRGEELKQFNASGLTKQKAKEDAAKQMALSGHCVKLRYKV